MDRSSQLQENLSAIQGRIEAASLTHNRPIDAVQLLPVSKTKPASDIEALYAMGLTAFGENYVQEAIDKIAALSHLDITWHFIGHMQSNKTQPIAQHFDWVHTVDREKIATRLNEARDGVPLNVLIQVNVDQAPTKSGVNPDALDTLVDHILACPKLTLRGLMSIPDPADALALAQSHARLKTLFDEIQSSGRVSHQFDTLSMGMTTDLELAIAHGSTMVRIGTALFGARAPKEST